MKKFLPNIIFGLLYSIGFLLLLAAAVSPFIAVYYGIKEKIEFRVAFMGYFIFSISCLILLYPIARMLKKIANKEDPDRRGMKHRYAQHMASIFYAFDKTR